VAFKEFLEDLYAPMGGVSVRAMFGGLGVFKDAIMFALAVDDVLYLRADEQSELRYAQEKAPRFVYRGMKGREVPMPYWQLPERLYDEPDEFILWATAAFDAARRAAAAKGKGKSAKKAQSAKPATAKAPNAKRPSSRPGPTAKRAARRR
jgi:DNA transformation protein